MKDVTEFLASIEINPHLGEVRETVTYQDSCHLAHGQGVRSAPRELLRQVPGLNFPGNAARRRVLRKRRDLQRRRDENVDGCAALENGFGQRQPERPASRRRIPDACCSFRRA